MSNTYDLSIKSNIDLNRLPEILRSIFREYKGYFSYLSQVKIGLPEGYGDEIIKGLDISDKEFSKIKNLEIPNKCKIIISLKNYGTIRILKTKEGDSFSISLEHFDKKGIEDMLEFVRVALPHIKGEAFILGEEIGPDFFSYIECNSLHLIGAKTKKEIIEIIKSSFTKNLNLSDKEVVEEIKKNTQGFKKFAKDFWIINFMSFTKPDRYGRVIHNKFNVNINKKYKSLKNNFWVH